MKSIVSQTNVEVAREEFQENNEELAKNKINFSNVTINTINPILNQNSVCFNNNNNISDFTKDLNSSLKLLETQNVNTSVLKPISIITNNEILAPSDI